MSNTLAEIAQKLKDANKKAQLIYAFNGMGKTRLSREFKQLVVPKEEGGEGDGEADATELSRDKILYYNAFTEDLFYWDNDLELDAIYKLKIQPNSFTDWILKDQGQDQNIIANFQRYANEKLTPIFNAEYKILGEDKKEITIEAFSEVTFSLDRGNNDTMSNLKISKGEEGNFIWSIFYTLLEQMVSELNIADVGNRSTDVFNNIEYVFIDDPVSSLDENHLIELAVNLASLIKSSPADLKYIVTTHNPLFYNVLYSELKTKLCYMLERLEDGTFDLTEKMGASNKAFSYHLYLKQTIEQAASENKIQRYHFTLLRNLYEKTANFLGYPEWSELLPDDKQAYLSRIMNFTSHSTLSNEAVAEPSTPEKAMVKLLLDHLIKNYGYWTAEPQNV